MAKEIMTPKEFAYQMHVIATTVHDEEVAHATADDLMENLLTALGYGEGVQEFEAMPKWYA